MVNYFFGFINENLIKEYKNLDYINNPFNDQKTIKKWKNFK